MKTNINKLENGIEEMTKNEAQRYMELENIKKK